MSLTETPPSQFTSPSLLGRATTGDPLAWQRLVPMCGPLVYSWARRTGLQAQDAADVTQETFTAVSSRLVVFDTNKSSATFRGWLWTFTRNKAADIIRARQLQPGARGGSTNFAKLNAITAQSSMPQNSKTMNRHPRLLPTSNRSCAALLH